MIHKCGCVSRRLNRRVTCIEYNPECPSCDHEFARGAHYSTRIWGLKYSYTHPGIDAESIYRRRKYGYGFTLIEDAVPVHNRYFDLVHALQLLMSDGEVGLTEKQQILLARLLLT